MIHDINVRFFIYEQDDDTGELDVIEVMEQEFKEAEGEIEYERHSISENGCRQICLTKRNGY